MIKTIIFIQEDYDIDFHQAIRKSVNKCQQEGQTVDVQYGGVDKEGTYSALIIGREK